MSMGWNLSRGECIVGNISMWELNLSGGVICPGRRLTEGWNVQGGNMTETRTPHHATSLHASQGVCNLPWSEHVQYFVIVKQNSSGKSGKRLELITLLMSVLLFINAVSHAYAKIGYWVPNGFSAALDSNQAKGQAWPGLHSQQLIADPSTDHIHVIN